MMGPCQCGIIHVKKGLYLVLSAVFVYNGLVD
jgi:hypothetical protein